MAHYDPSDEHFSDNGALVGKIASGLMGGNKYAKFAIVCLDDHEGTVLMFHKSDGEVVEVTEPNKDEKQVQVGITGSGCVTYKIGGQWHEYCW